MQRKCLNYPVEFIDDSFGEASPIAGLLQKLTSSEAPKVLIVADMNMVQRMQDLGAKIGRYVQAHNICLAGKPVVVNGGEKAKSDNLQSALTIISAILEAKLGRNDIVLAIGGGSVLDVAGYAASQVRGGIKLVRMPTTPAAMVDAAFAEYAAVDSASVKDALRVPSIPAAVVIDTTLALSVLDGVWRGGGVSELVRLSVASDAALWKKIVKLLPDYIKRDTTAFKTLVEAAIAVRQKKGGTTFAEWTALRLEAMSGYKLPHGYAVAIGIYLNLNCAVEKGMMDAKVRDEVVEVLKSSGALDGLGHSSHLLSQAESLALGVNAWKLSSEELSLPTKIGVLTPVDDLTAEEVKKSIPSVG